MQPFSRLRCGGGTDDLTPPQARHDHGHRSALMEPSRQVSPLTEFELWLHDNANELVERYGNDAIYYVSEIDLRDEGLKDITLRELRRMISALVEELSQKSIVQVFSLFQ